MMAKHDPCETDNAIRPLAKKDAERLGKLRQQIEYVEIDEVTPSPNAARIIRNGIPKVAESIRQFGFRSPIYVDGTKGNEIISGHTRFFAAKELGLRHVPIVKVTDLSPKLVKLLRLADNRVAEFSTWDFSNLNAELSELKLELPDIDFADLGFIDTPKLDFDEAEDLDEGNYEEPQEKCLCCPKCGFTAGKAFFTKKETDSADKENAM